MDLIIRPFEESDFGEYQGWFGDTELRKQLGIVDEEWLEYVLNDDAGQQFVAVNQQGQTIIGSIGIALPDVDHRYFVITDIAVRPDLKGQGIGRKIIDLIIARFTLSEDQRWGAFVMPENHSAKKFFVAIGWHELTDFDTDMHFFVHDG